MRQTFHCAGKRRQSRKDAIVNQDGLGEQSPNTPIFTGRGAKNDLCCGTSCKLTATMTPALAA
ncbi:hypothetical protein GCM10011430_11110 [Oxalicibacterium solurbis]|uniref:Uncharacterized protein n=1 Tax=Oxalicibacterium solurbis TaxID=69280 RepID=A0A8J3AZM6_9BURK|nr:hypothetical protein GCM10011430_11110 [Oxalicibacterium solurbis]